MEAAGSLPFEVVVKSTFEEARVAVSERMGYKGDGPGACVRAKRAWMGAGANPPVIEDWLSRTAESAEAGARRSIGCINQEGRVMWQHKLVSSSAIYA